MLLEDSGVYSLNLPYENKEIIGFINANGLLKIGNDLYKYEKQYVRIIHDGDESKLKLLSELTESSREYNVTVHTIQERLIALDNNSAINARFTNTASCTGDRDKERVRGGAVNTFNVYVDILGNTPNPGTYQVSYSFYVEMAAWIKKGLFGGYIQKRTRSLKAEGDVRIDPSILGVGLPVRNIDVNVIQSNFSWEYSRVLWSTGYYVLEDPSVILQPTVTGDITFYGRGGTECSI